MSYLISKMLPCLLIAGLLGAFIGWLLKRGCKNKDIHIDDDSLDATHRVFEQAQIQNKEVEDLKSKLNIARLSAQDSAIRVDDFDLKLKDKDIQIQSLKTQLSQNSSIEQEYELLSSKLSRTEYSLVDKESMLGALTTQLDSAKDSQKELDLLKVELKRANSDVSSYKQKAVDLESDYKLKLNDSKASVIGDYDLKFNDYQKEIDLLKSELEKSNVDIASYKQKAVEVESDYKLKLEDTNNEFKLVRDKEADFEAIKKELEKDKNSELNFLKLELEKANADNVTYKQKTVDLESDYKLKLEDSKVGIVGDYDLKLKNSQSEIDALKLKLSDAKTLVDHKDQEMKLLSGRLIESDLSFVNVSKDLSRLESPNFISSQDSIVEDNYIDDKFKPETEDKPRDGKPDNLQLIKGVGGKLEGVLNELGIYHYDQIASWNEKETGWVNQHLAFSGRIENEEWIPQAKDLMTGKMSDFAKRADRGEVATSSGTHKPKFLKQARDGKPDNLELIKGVGGKLHGVLNELGVYHFDQIASWDQKEVNWVNEHLAFTGRIEREGWIPQAKDLRDGKEGDFARRVNRGEVATSSSTKKPKFLKKPRDGKADNLQLIKGVGKKLEAVLNELGVYHFDQVSDWNQKEINWVNDHLVFTGRVEREEWIKQAKVLLAGDETDFSKRVKKGEVPTSNKKK